MFGLHPIEMRLQSSVEVRASGLNVNMANDDAALVDCYKNLLEP